MDKNILSFTDAAEKILKEEKQPMSYSRIAEIALSKGLIQSEAKDPAFSLYVSLRSDDLSPENTTIA